MSVCVFAGTFDPITKGHVAVIKKLLKKYKKVLVVVGENSDKNPLFTTEQRVSMAKACFYNEKRVAVIDYLSKKDNYASYLEQIGAKYHARGIRNAKDLEYEKKAEEINKKLYPFITTVYFNTHGFNQSVSSTLVREKILKGQDYKRFVPKKIYPLIKEIIKNKSN